MRMALLSRETMAGTIAVQVQKLFVLSFFCKQEINTTSLQAHTLATCLTNLATIATVIPMAVVQLTCLVN